MNFMDDGIQITFDYLPLTVRMATLGGIATPLIMRGTPLPTKRRQNFTTAVDDQKAVSIELLLGESPIAVNDILIGRFDLEDLPLEKRGILNIEVVIEVDKKCKLKVIASERQTKKSILREFENLYTYMTEGEVKTILKKAEESKAIDDEKLKRTELINKAKAAIAEAENAIGNNYLISTSELRKNIEEKIAALGLALQNESENDIIDLTSQLGKLSRQVAGSSINFFDSNLFGDLFGNFGVRSNSPTSSPVRENKNNTQGNEGKSKSDDKHNEERSQVVATKNNREALGKIFGGGDFTNDSGLCFVLMPFKKELQPVYEDHIRKIVESEGLSCLRSDEIIKPNQITRDIWEKVNRARLIIADLTGKNPNVFYEVGLAHAIGKDVILITQTAKDVPFDLKALRYIEYSYTPRDVKSFESKLSAAIKELINNS